jgi:hypothetical protein
MAANRNIAHATHTSNLADVLERVLDKGVVIAGDIKIKLVDIELLTIQIRLVICSVERAKEIGMDFWRHEPSLSSLARVEAQPTIAASPQSELLPAMQQRVDHLEEMVRRLEQRLVVP